MITLQISKIPFYLQSSDFYRSLDVDEDEFISVPKQNFKMDTQVTSIRSFVHMLHTMRFWGIRTIPIGVVLFMEKEFASVCVSEAVAEFSKELPWLSTLRILLKQPKSNRMFTAIRLGDVDALQALYELGLPLHKHSCCEAASLGHFECLKFAHQLGCSWTPSSRQMNACKAAALNGHVECLQYAMEHGCSFVRQNLFKDAVELSPGLHQVFAPSTWLRLDERSKWM